MDGEYSFLITQNEWTMMDLMKILGVCIGIFALAVILVCTFSLIAMVLA
jgi:hypothetical protein